MFSQACVKNSVHRGRAWWGGACMAGGARGGDVYGDIYNAHTPLRHNHMERQAAAAASQMQVYGDASLDAPNRPQIHRINLPLHLPLTLDVPLDTQCVYTLRALQC